MTPFNDLPTAGDRFMTRTIVQIRPQIKPFASGCRRDRSYHACDRDKVAFPRSLVVRTKPSAQFDPAAQKRSCHHRTPEARLSAPIAFQQVPHLANHECTPATLQRPKPPKPCDAISIFVINRMNGAARGQRSTILELLRLYQAPSAPGASPKLASKLLYRLQSIAFIPSHLVLPLEVDK